MKEQKSKPGVESRRRFFNNPIVHLLRHSLDFVRRENNPLDRFLILLTLQGPQDRGCGAQGHRPRHRADAGAAALTAFEGGAWGAKYSAIGQNWRCAWPEVIPIHAFAPDVRRILCTTNAMEALSAKLRRAVRARGHFPTDEAALKLLFLVLNRAGNEWTAVSTGRCNALVMEVAMTTGKPKSERSTRRKLHSPGRPGVARQVDPRRFWSLIASGLSSEDAAVETGIPQPV